MNESRKRRYELDEVFESVRIEPDAAFTQGLRARLRKQVEARLDESVMPVNGQRLVVPSEHSDTIRRPSMLKSRLLPAAAVIMMIALAAVLLFVVPNLRSGQGSRPSDEGQAPTAFQPSAVPTLTGTPSDSSQPVPLDDAPFASPTPAIEGGVMDGATPVAGDNGTMLLTPTPMTNRLSVDDPRLAAFFEDYADATFVLLDGQTKEAYRYNPARASARLSPFSTFEILATLIGVETFVIDDADQVFTYDSDLYPPTWPTDEFPYSEWAQDQTLRSAMQYSVDWFFEDVAKQVREPVMDEWVRFINYGNADTSSGPIFWQGGSLEVSTFEQLIFLQAFYEGSLPFRTQAAETVRDVIVLEETAVYRISGQSDSGEIEAGRQFAMMSGYAEVGEDVYFFSMNMEGETVPDRAGFIELAKDILIEMGYLPE